MCVFVYSHMKKHWKDIRRLRGRHWELGMSLLTFLKFCNNVSVSLLEYN